MEITLNIRYEKMKEKIIYIYVLSDRGKIIVIQGKIYYELFI